MSYQKIITIEPGKRGGKPCIRRMRITVYDVLGWLAAGMSFAEILDDFPELTEEDIKACLEFAADREHRLVAMVGDSWNYYSTKILVVKLLRRLADIFPDASHLQFEGMTAATDTEIWEFAKAGNFFILTQDADFAEKSRLYQKRGFKASPL